MSAALASAIVAELDDAALAGLVLRLAQLDDAALVPLRNRLAPLSADEWFDTHQAANYLGIGVSVLQRKAKAGDVPAHQDVPGGNYAYRRSELDQWRSGQ